MMVELTWAVRSATLPAGCHRARQPSLADYAEALLALTGVWSAQSARKPHSAAHPRTRGQEDQSSSLEWLGLSPGSGGQGPAPGASMHPPASRIAYSPATCSPDTAS